MNNEKKEEIVQIHRKFKEALLFASLDKRQNVREYYRDAVARYMDVLLNAYLNADRQFDELAKVSNCAADIIREQRNKLDFASGISNKEKQLRQAIKLFEEEDGFI